MLYRTGFQQLASGTFALLLAIVFVGAAVAPAESVEAASISRTCLLA
ncbi:hypothetical protein [Sphingosinicella humi]|nr:hypothetical protein [Sphingosinicella humi]